MCDGRAIGRVPRRAPELVVSGVELKGMYASDPQGYLTLLVDFEQYLEHLQKRGMDTPYRQQALQFWRITKRFVVLFLAQYYETP